MARISGSRLEASELYDHAIAAAKENEYIQEAALANELAAKFYLEWNKDRIAQEYMIQAYYGYVRWGANAKVADLETRYPQLLVPVLQQPSLPLSITETILAPGTGTSSSSSSGITSTLDLAAILKASQTLSSEIELEKLLSTLLHVVIENAGADKCVLLLLEDNHLIVRAIHAATRELSMEAQGTTLLSPQPLECSLDVPIGLINTVRRSLQSTVLVNAVVHPQWMTDPYIQRQQPKSILCSPILQQGKLLGVLYLENNLATGAFTSDRVEILNFLCAQAAISLENARLYEQVQQALDNTKLMQFSIDRGSTPVCWVEPDARISYANDAFCRDIGYSHEEILTKYVYDFNPDFSREDWSGHWQAVRQQGTVTFESRMCNREGIAYPVEVTANHMLFQGKEFHLTFMVNICDRKRAESAILQKSQELEQALHNLQQAQLQVIQSEKMSSLGQMVAGIAHEINNPVNFIHGNLNHVDRYSQDLLSLVHLYQQHYPHPAQLIQDQLDEIELPFLVEDLTKVLQSMRVGTHRIREIVLSLRNFSRLDEAEVKDVNIHDGIDSTLTILHNRLKARAERPEIQVLKAYSNLPLVECYAGQLNQVFMNIISNAIDALDEHDRQRSYEDIESNPSIISIRTDITSNHWIRICIADNGPGMQEKVRQRIFDPFFTTKPVGKGTGLGLSISYQIVTEKHGGQLRCDSRSGWGTQFTIEIPIKSLKASEVKLPVVSAQS